ncbi:transferase transferring acyl groups [Zea mays]|uniref:Transferase transferring acyl groups n=1 Tax=Zea mays TaxID=4577 RepID=A0A1D6K4F3_MAIZE|nr:transferase transferring acyl groups [Zea mays]
MCHRCQSASVYQIHMMYLTVFLLGFLRSFKAALSSISPLVFLGFARIISTWGVDYQVHVGEYGVHWNFFFTLAAVSILTSIVRIHPKHCGLVGLLILAGYQIWLSSGLNEYLISDKRSADIISQNKEGIYSILGYWGMFLIGVSLGFYLFFDTSSKGKNRNTQVMKIWVLAALFWILAIIFDSYIERVSRRMCNFAYVMLVFGQNFQCSYLLSNRQILDFSLTICTLSDNADKLTHNVAKERFYVSSH